MIVLYSFAHSDPRGSPGASSVTGITERTVSETAFEPFKVRCEAEGFEVKDFSGPLEPKIRLMNKAIGAAQKAGLRWASVELHFNNTGEEVCPNEDCKRLQFFAENRFKMVRTMKHIGVPCPACGTPSPVRWRFGHTAMLYRYSWSSVELASSVLDELSGLMTWSKRKPPILMPDSRYGRKAWPRFVFRPAVLIEAGFGCEPIFAAWIAKDENQAALGMAVADGLCKWYASRAATSVEDWPL